MKYYFSDEYENMFSLYTADSLSGIGGQDYINVMPTCNASNIAYHGNTFRHVEPYYKKFTYIYFHNELSEFLKKENLRINVEKKIGILPVIDWLKFCRPYIKFRSLEQFAKCKLTSNIFV